MAVPSNCLGCNGSTVSNDRRLLSGQSTKSGQVYAAWKEILELKVNNDHRLAAAGKRMEATGASCGYLCRKCFSLLDRYHNLKCSILNNIDLVISSFNQVCQVDSEETTDMTDNAQPAKVPRLCLTRRQLNFSHLESQSPPVVVST